jgi:hypothetical protein
MAQIPGSRGGVVETVAGCWSLKAHSASDHDTTLTLRARAIHYRGATMAEPEGETATRGGTSWLNEHRF